MIVKDEEDTIEKCMTSVSKYIDYYVIVDTGSKDNTVAKIKEVGDKLGIKGEVHERPWVDFSYNRTEALNLAKGKCDYRFMMDADDFFVAESDKNPFESISDHSCYAIKLKFADIEYYRYFLFRSDQDWKFVGVLHEYAHLEGDDNKGPQLGHCHIVADISPLKRAKSAKEKYAKDAKILEKALKKEPNNPRYMFYLAQSYRDSFQYEKAILAYKKRSEMGGWEEEVYISLYSIALISEMLNRNSVEVMDKYSKAWEYRPHRLEAIYSIMKNLRLQKRYILAFTYGNMAAQNYRDTDVLFVNVPIKKWLFVDEYCMAAFYVGQYQLAYDNMLKFIESDTFKEIPESEQERLKDNFKYYEEKVNKNV